MSFQHRAPIVYRICEHAVQLNAGHIEPSASVSTVPQVIVLFDTGHFPSHTYVEHNCVLIKVDSGPALTGHITASPFLSQGLTDPQTLVEEEQRF